MTEFKIERTIRKWGDGSYAFVIPPDLMKYLQLNEGDKVILIPQQKEKGKFAAFWKKQNE